MKKLFCIIFLLFIISVCVNASSEHWKILEPREASPAYRHAANEFCKFYQSVTGQKLEIIKEPEAGVSLVIIGSDCVNRFTRDAIERNIIKPLDLGVDSDEYMIFSAKEGGRNLLFLAGGNGRATLYAVYDFFERQAGCRYFWDGDIIPESDSIVMTDIDIREKPRFYYRGLRYFAHRSLSRFQAEHWGPKEWEREIDWILKKRLNMFMLRIGMDDIFQKAFPGIVPYPPVDSILPEAKTRSFYDRTTAWPLSYRGKLRHHILTYAKERELIHPEDMGTMTHWYSCMPNAFLDSIHPSFCPQSGGAYLGDPCNAVWDIRDDRNLENYWKLTQTHINTYGSPQMFHTIGIAEREVYANRSDNLEMKLYAYKRFINKLREYYPNAPVLIASWDFYYPGWRDYEIQRLFSQLDPMRTIILDYTSDLPSNSRSSDFTKWGIVGRFPYTFGIFHAYEWENDLRGYYDIIAKRLPVAVSDPMCKGFVYWPETSHSDPFMLEYFTHNAWNPNSINPYDLLSVFCRSRYGCYAEKMEKAWRAVMPFAEKCIELPLVFREIREIASSKPDSVGLSGYRKSVNKVAPLMKQLPDVIECLAAVPYGAGNSFVDRDAVDLARTLIGRMYAVAWYHYLLAQHDWEKGEASASEVRNRGKDARKLLLYLRDILSLHDDYSMQASMKQIKDVYMPVNPAFEQALKGNAENSYCRTYISEMFDYYYIPEFEHYYKEINRELNNLSCVLTYDAEKMDMQSIVDAFYDKPLVEMCPLNPRPRTGKEFRKQIYKLREFKSKFN